MFAPGYLDVLLRPGPSIEGGGGPMPPPRPPRPRPRPRPGMAPGIAKSGFAAFASSITSSCLMGRRGIGPPGPGYGPNWPAGAPISGLQLGLTGRCETEVKWDASDAAGERDPSGRSSNEDVRGRFGSLVFNGGGAARKLGFEMFCCAYPPGMSDEGIGGGFDRAGSANLGSTSS